MFVYTNSALELTGVHNVDTLQDHQRVVVNVMDPMTPYRGVLVLFQTGSGKTYMSAALAHLWVIRGYQVIFSSYSINSRRTFKDEYKFYVQSNQYDNYIDSITILGLKDLIKTPLKDALVIIDEVHHIRDNSERYKTVKGHLDKYGSCRIMLMTATPMVDNHTEIDDLKKLVHDDVDNVLMITHTVPDLSVDVIYEGEKTLTGYQVQSSLKGKQMKEYHETANNAKHITRLLMKASSIDSFEPNVPVDEQSSKVAKILEYLKHGELTFIYSFYVNKSGVLFIREVLRHIGFVEWTDGDKISRETRRFAICHGGITEQENEKVLHTFASPENRDGRLIEILIGSSSCSESVTFKNVRHVHILTPFWNESQFLQAIGRTIRYGSHEYLPESKRNIRIYRHCAILDDIETIDEYVFKTSFDKQLSIDKVMEKCHEKSLQPKNSPNETIYTGPLTKYQIRHMDEVWDLTECFDRSHYQRSFLRVRRSNARLFYGDNWIYSSLPACVIIKTELPPGVSAWLSFVDDKIRISYNTNNNSKSKKHIKRGRNILKLGPDDIDWYFLQLDLEVKGLISSKRNLLLKILKERNMYFEQVSIECQCSD